MPQFNMPSPSLPPPPAKPQMPAVAPPAMPQVSPPQMPAAAPAAKSSNILVIVIFCLLAFLVGGVLVYVVMRHG
jgi:hypothetical protein